MKKVAATMMVCFLSVGVGTSCAEGGNRKEVDRLWKEYEKATEKDLPQKATKILGQIKDKARAEKLSYDFWRAATQYVRIGSQRDWKLRDELTESMNAEFISYGDPIILYVSGIGFNNYDASECAEFLDKWSRKLKSTRSSEFWDKTPVGYKGEVMRAHIHNDYEYVLLSMTFNHSLSNSIGYEKIEDRFNSTYSGTYPVDALYELYRISAGSAEAYEGYAEKYEGKAAATLAKLNALSFKFRRLKERNATDEEYRRLRAYCEELVAEKKRFYGEEKLILKGEDAAENMIEELDSKRLNAEVHGQDIEIRLQNLKDVNISVYTGEELNADKLTKKDVPVWTKTLDVKTERYYVNDTLKVRMPELPDGEFLAVFESGKFRHSCKLSQHSVALSATRAADGWLL